MPSQVGYEPTDRGHEATGAPSARGKSTLVVVVSAVSNCRQTLLDRKPDALFSANILIPYGVIGTMAGRGMRPPRDLRLATFNRPPLHPAFGPN